MKKVIEILQEELSAAFEKAGYDKKYAKVGVSNSLIFASISVTERLRQLKSTTKLLYRWQMKLLNF